VEDDLATISLQDVERADTTALPIVGLLLLVVFGTFSAAVLPLILAIIRIPLALVVIYPIASASPITTSVTSIVSIIGLGLSIDYSLFITRRFREELARGRDTREAMAWTVGCLRAPSCWNSCGGMPLRCQYQAFRWREAVSR